LFLVRSNTSFFRAAVVVLILCITGCDRESFPELIAARITVFSGNNQDAPDGLRLGQPLAVRVTGVGGGPTPGVEVFWQVEQGSGQFRSYPDDQTLTPAKSVTDSNGVARVYFLPQVLGPSLISASAVELAPLSATFVATDKPNVEIVFGPIFDCTPFNDPSSFSLTNHSPVLTAPINAKVGLSYATWLAASCTARIRTRSVPEGGEPFDSGVLSPGQIFVFTPRVAGTWEFEDVINGGTGRLVVR
jgi:hypothetical protein